jgi:hypothetical protein
VSRTLPDTSRTDEMLDPRVSVEMYKEKLDPAAAIAERVAEAERRRKAGQ